MTTQQAMKLAALRHIEEQASALAILEALCHDPWQAIVYSRQRAELDHTRRSLLQGA